VDGDRDKSGIMHAVYFVNIRGTAWGINKFVIDYSYSIGRNMLEKDPQPILSVFIDDRAERERHGTRIPTPTDKALKAAIEKHLKTLTLPKTALNQRVNFDLFYLHYPQNQAIARLGSGISISIEMDNLTEQNAKSVLEKVKLVVDQLQNYGPQSLKSQFN
jgi:hypothetical protein